MTVFDARTLHHLIEVTENQAFVLKLVGTYRTLLPSRIERIETFVAASDTPKGLDAALDAARSLKGGSLMTGAVELAGIATDIEDDLRDGDVASARGRVGLLAPAAERILGVLHDFELSLQPTARAEQPAQASIDSMR